MEKITIDITDLAPMVVLHSESRKAHHICTREQYKFAAELDQKGYDWKPVGSFETEEECQECIASATEKDDLTLDFFTMAQLKEIAEKKGYPEEEWKGLKRKADLIAYLESMNS